MKHNLKLAVFSFIMSSIFSFNALCQTKAFTELTTILTPVEGGPNGVAFGIQGGFIYEVNSAYRIGGGLGIIEPKEFETSPIIPLFMRNQFFLSSNYTVNPYINLDLGYQLNTEEPRYGSIFVNPAFGVNINSFYINVGYMGSIGTYDNAEWVNSISLTIGKDFNTSKNCALYKFLQKTIFGVDLSYDFSMNKIKIPEYTLDLKPGYLEIIETGNKIKVNPQNNIQVKLHWLYKFNKQFHAGVGFGYSSSKYETEEISSSGSYSSYFIRGEYLWFSEGKYIPYTTIDLGKSYGGTTVTSQMGLKVNNHLRLSASYSFVKDLYDCSEVNAHLVGINLGFDF